MKKAMAITATAMILLSACGSKETTGPEAFNGKWEKADGEPAVCRDSFSFKGEDTFEIQNSRTQGGETSTGTYKKIEGDDYQFDYGGGSDMFTIKIDGDTMTAQMSGSKNICKYNKKTE
ncbi:MULTISPECIES: hypothetical protein [Priestia]|uniref:hypothetical protein n=1 Tax=Priestia TaxID=2800373 RepID=UPI0012B8166F|nr:hypothetical protein [Priestia megaterium]MBU8855383.1 hypothetical protein [Bacillus sp. FJAT-26377]